MRRKVKNVTRIEIPLDIYRCSVVIFFGATLKQIMSVGRRRGIAAEFFPREWSTTLEDWIADEDCNGFCASYGSLNRDIVVWLRKRPERSREYGTLYHELYHAVDHVASGIDERGTLTDRFGTSEARAMIFEYLVNTANRVLWS